MRRVKESFSSKILPVGSDSCVYLSINFGEALALGVATGPVCLATCGPAVAPWLLAQQAGLKTHGRLVALFLCGRLAGYLLFAALAWLVGRSIPQLWSGGPWLAGVVDLLLAAALVAYVAGWRLHLCRGKRKPQLLQIGVAAAAGRRSGLVLGFLTGLNLCPPFLAAGVKAAELSNLAAALLFFLAFFLATAVWFLPVVALGLVRRPRAAATVARLAAILLALWYAGNGTILLLAEAVRG